MANVLLKTARARSRCYDDTDINLGQIEGKVQDLDWYVNHTKG